MLGKQWLLTCRAMAPDTAQDHQQPWLCAQLLAEWLGTLVLPGGRLSAALPESTAKKLAKVDDGQHLARLARLAGRSWPGLEAMRNRWRVQTGSGSSDGGAGGGSSRAGAADGSGSAGCATAALAGGVVGAQAAAAGGSAEAAAAAAGGTSSRAGFKACCHCGRAGGGARYQRCNGCWGAWYCGALCQKLHWVVHKSACAAASTARRAAISRAA